jgi:prepilin-type N-terminal cleavage/methylation domain-containing protein
MLKILFRRENGFTLIELLIVIVILGVLAAAIFPNLTKFLGEGNEAVANAELRAVKTGVVGFVADNNGLFPCTVQPTEGNPQTVNNASVRLYIQSQPDIRGGYLVDTTGVVSGDPANPFPGLTWDDVNGVWVR